MSNKIPCGGFYLDDMLNVNDNGELSIKGGAPYQQLVTDGTGTAMWEQMPAFYMDSVELKYDGVADGKETIDFNGRTFVLVERIYGLRPRSFLGAFMNTNTSSSLIKETDISIIKPDDPCVFLVKDSILCNEYVGLYALATMSEFTITTIDSYHSLSPYYSGVCGLIITRNSKGEYSANISYNTLVHCYFDKIPIFGSIYDRQNNCYSGHIDRVALDVKSGNLSIDIYSNVGNSLTQLIYSEDGAISETNAPS